MESQNIELQMQCISGFSRTRVKFSFKMLTLKVLLTTAADDILIFFFIF